jgi:flagellar biosynthesis GTPase FlhF
MKRRQFIKFFFAGSLGAAGLGLSGCEEYESGTYGRYDYDYYPDNNVYFYYGDGVWIRTGTLPIYIVLTPSYRRRVYITDRYPYARNKEHRRTFPRRPRRPSQKDRVIQERDRAERELQRRREQPRKRDRTDQEQQRRQELRRKRDRNEQEQQRLQELRRKRDRTDQEQQRLQELRRKHYNHADDV